MVGAATVVVSLVIAAPQVLALPSPYLSLTWTKHLSNPIFAVGSSGAWDDYQVTTGTVLIAGTTFHLWYSGSHDGFTSEIGHATSSDGINWTRDPQNPIVKRGGVGTWNERASFFPIVLRDGGRYLMWFAGYDMSSTPGTIGYAESVDSSVWTFPAANPVIRRDQTWEFVSMIPGPVVQNASGYRMWYSATSTGQAWSAGLAMSTDGINWTKYAGNPVIAPGLSGAWDDYRIHPSAMADGGGFLAMWYVGADTSLRQQVGIAVSTDGVHWTGSNRSALGPGIGGAWDSVGLSRVAVSAVGIELWMWFSGAGPVSGSLQIGLATALNPYPLGGTGASALWWFPWLFPIGIIVAGGVVVVVAIWLLGRRKRS